MPVESMRIPETRHLLVHGFVFHEPDCRSEADVQSRLAAVQSDGYSFYSFGMAARPHRRWLQRSLKGHQQT